MGGAFLGVIGSDNLLRVEGLRVFLATPTVNFGPLSCSEIDLKLLTIPGFQDGFTVN